MRQVYTVAVYDTDLAYGGPEEGGWYYDTGSLVRPLKMFRDEERAYAYCRRVNDKLHSAQKRAGKHDPSSVLSEGWLAAEVHEGALPAGYPDRRPHYE